METGDKYLGVTKSHTWKSFNRKINAKDVELESLERVDYFGTSEYF